LPLKIIEQEVYGAAGNSGDAIHIEVKAKSRVSFKKCAPLDATADIAEDLG
jgi:hypothetical protein